METIILWAPRVATCLLLFIGILGLLKPKALTDATGINLTNATAFSEARSIFGGMHLGTAATALIFDQPVIYACLGMGFVGVIVARIYSMVADGTDLKTTMTAIIIDGVIGLAFLASFITLSNQV